MARLDEINDKKSVNKDARKTAENSVASMPHHPAHSSGSHSGSRKTGKKSATQEKISRKTTRRGKSRLSSNQGRTLLARRRVVGYGLRNFSRNTWLTVAATVVMTITLLMVFTMLVASLVSSETITDQRAKMDMSIYIKSDVSDDTLNNLAGKLRVQPNISDVKVSNSDEQYEIAKELNKDNPNYMQGLATAQQIGAPVVYSALITVKFHDPNKAQDVKDFVASDPQFEKWLDDTRNSADSTKIQQTTTDRLSAIINNVQRFGLLIVILFIAISVLIVFNTIRMAIFSRREEIDMMKAIGADRSFIRGPFLIEAELYGVISALLAVIIGYSIIDKMLPKLGNYLVTTNTQQIMNDWAWAIGLVMVLIGFLIGGISARLAVRRYLRR